MRLDEAELVRWGTGIGADVNPPVVIGLSGQLGAGKSVLARAIGAGAGVTATMPSPSYTLVQRYQGRDGRLVVHIDLYRIESPEELAELGWSHLGDVGEIVLVEWPERAEDLMPPDHWLIQLDVAADEPLLRDIEVRRAGSPPPLAPFPLTVAP
ncbi:MAG: tRNA (adenosine(37)-N6)-threonylcarbamoyltransferase complex ATPase subunit type 1 TsaE [Gemmatimonadota bacterium]|jgi:tRNA threonylcarbamoyladenosine biosynthesis protein TsaE